MARPVNQEELDFLQAIEDYKKKNDKLFLSWTEVLGVIKKLGYSRTAQKRSSSKVTAKSTSQAKTPKATKAAS
ncbi:MAG: hypothetical protein AAEJ04_05155 [Planctomycetota bacterium]